MSLFWLFEFCLAAQPTVLKVGKSGAYLYLQDDAESEKVEILRAGEEVTPVLQMVGRGTWHLVRTQSGRTGWLRAVDVEPVTRNESPVKTDESVIRFGPRSTWTASSSGGRTLDGTWTGTIDRSTGTASGSWTVRDAANRIVLSGTWSAAKSEGKWRGSWRALALGQPGERSGTWRSEVQIPADAPLANLFEWALRQAVGGSWQSAGQSGSWSIRAAR